MAFSLVRKSGSDDPRSNRLTSIDAYRGMVMLLMMAEVLHLKKVATNTGSPFWEFLARHQNHVDWGGCSLHDLIQPSFSFLVGVSLPFSLARRSGDGQPAWRRTLHAFSRSLILICLGLFLRSTSRKHTNWTFEDTLSQIGLGYTFLYIAAQFSRWVQWITLAVVLVGYWTAFVLYPVPGSTTDFAAHWALNTNLAWRFDTWFLNLFPRESTFTGNPGGYCTLSFIPTLGTMILGLLAGGELKDGRTHWTKFSWLFVAGAVFLALGWLLNEAGVCPVVKRIWTPSWVLFSGGFCFLFLALFYLALDVSGWKGWAVWLVLVGMNSIAAYLIDHLVEPFIADSIRIHFGDRWANVAGTPYNPLVFGAVVLLLEWLILLWMYRKKIFLRI